LTNAGEIRSVLVTGASGFVGTEVCATFVRAGLTVHGVVRTHSRPLAKGVIAHLVPDLADATALRSAIDGVDAVVHLAARAHIVREQPGTADRLFHETNVEGTRDVFECAVANGVRRFVYASSLKVMGLYPGRPWTEADPPAPIDAYGRSKLAAENLLLGSATSSRIEIGILRLPLVYGPRVRANMLQLFELVDRGIPLPFGGVRNSRTLLFSRNAADAMLALLRTANLSRDIFFVGDSVPLSTEALIRGIAGALGRPARVFRMPRSLLAAAARVGDLASAVFPFALTSETLDRLTGSQECAIGKLEAVTGFRPHWSTQEGLAITADWYQSARRHRTVP
jgi:UDP-glucose 4-epimerase